MQRKYHLYFSRCVQTDDLQNYLEEHEAVDKASDALELLALSHVTHSTCILHGHLRSTERFPQDDELPLNVLQEEDIQIVYYRNHYDLLLPADAADDILVSMRFD